MAKCIWYKACQWLAAGCWFSPDTPVSSTNKTDCHDIVEMSLKVALNTKTLTHMPSVFFIDMQIQNKNTKERKYVFLNLMLYLWSIVDGYVVFNAIEQNPVSTCLLWISSFCNFSMMRSMAGFQENSHICRNTKLHIGYHVNSDTSPNTKLLTGFHKNYHISPNT